MTRKHFRVDTFIFMCVDRLLLMSLVVCLPLGINFGTEMIPLGQSYCNVSLLHMELDFNLTEL